ncbi:exopolygalacturonate lyase [Enterobacteriaceae bacterium 4M9]|nr:exopolygalacturonate lyase [Enterobacteriaceae bacterium 4M9]
MKKNVLLFSLVAVFMPASYATEIQVDELIWRATTFGQSTDLNFGSTILPEKVGLNQVTAQGKAVAPGKLAPTFTIESRGGKLANSHEGVTFYYTALPTDVNFTLAADVVLEQLGPETGAVPNRQEGAGLMVRDIPGTARLVPQPDGHEEFPSASNMVMNLLHAHTRTHDGRVNINASFREGIYHPWGTPGNRLSRVDYVTGVTYGPAEHYRLTLTRTNEGFRVSYQYGDEIVEHVVKGANANIVSMQDKDNLYIGFFASRNARMTVSNVDLQLSDAQTVNAPKYEAPQGKLVLLRASAKQSATDDYFVQALANYSGEFEVQQNARTMGKKVVTAGEMFSQPIELQDGENTLALKFTPSDGPTREIQHEQYRITRVSLPDPLTLYVAADGTPAGDGSSNKPLDLESAVELLPAGGTILLKDGDYQGMVLPVSASGRPDKMKHLRAQGKHVRFISELRHEAWYWHVQGIEIAGAQFIVHGSHNIFEKMVTHSAPDTGFVITSTENVGRALWASHNQVIESESYNNMDPSRINADGFAAKMRVGDGNRFERCLAHHNIDDGWDLFNKVEDGPNGVVTITDSIAFNNGRTLDIANNGGTIGNGFKLGGEGLPVPHVVKNNLAFNNNMDGFTDNFNPGALVLSGNVAINNQRFNFLIRKSPYASETQQGIFTHNRSYRFHTHSQYDDVINSAVFSDNDVIKQGVTRNQSGEPVNRATQVALEQAVRVDETLSIPGKKEALHLKHAFP